MVYPNPQNLTGMLGMMQYANEITENTWGIGILSAIFLIILLVSYRSEKRHSFASASYITAILAVFFRIGSLITDQQFFVFVALCGLSVIWTVFYNE